jgi:hypothetical protein
MRTAACCLILLPGLALGFVPPHVSVRSGASTQLSVLRDREEAVVFDSEGEFPLSALRDRDPATRVTEADLRACFQTGECEVSDEFMAEMTKQFNRIPYIASKATYTVMEAQGEHEEPVPWANKWQEPHDSADMPAEAYMNDKDPEFDI